MNCCKIQGIMNKKIHVCTILLGRIIRIKVKGHLKKIYRLRHSTYIFVISVKIHGNTCKHIPWTIWSFCHDDFNGCFVSNVFKVPI